MSHRTSYLECGHKVANPVLEASLPPISINPLETVKEPSFYFNGAPAHLFAKEKAWLYDSTPPPKTQTGKIKATLIRVRKTLGFKAVIWVCAVQRFECLNHQQCHRKVSARKYNLFGG